MIIKERLKVFLDTVDSAEEIANYRDPQEFMYMEGRDSASFSYAFAMYLFMTLTGKDYFDQKKIPADEYFMTVDPDSDFPVISPSDVPEEISDFSDVLGKMTMYKRKSRIRVSEAMNILKKMYDPLYSEEVTEKTDPENEVTDDDTVIENEISDENNTTQTKTIIFPEIDEDFDYGLILNNKRSGRIEFRRLFDCDLGKGNFIVLPAGESEEFSIGISRRHRDFRNISNPSSVYGDNIIPCAVLTANVRGFEKIKIEFERNDNSIKVNVRGADSFSENVSDRKSLRSSVRAV